MNEKKKGIVFFFLVCYVKNPNISQVILLSKKYVDIDIWETTGLLLYFHSLLNIRNVGIYQIYIDTDHLENYFLRFYKALFI